MSIPADKVTRLGILRQPPIVVVDNATEYVMTVNGTRPRWGRAGKGNLLTEALMGPGSVVIGHELRHHLPEMSLIDDQYFFRHSSRTVRTQRSA
jgi:hypothetical protein